MQQSRFLRRSQTQQAAADPVQLQQVPEAVASVLLRRFKAAVCQASKLAKTPNASLQLPGATQAAAEPFLQLQQVPEAVAMSFLWRFKAAVCQASKLAKTLQTLPCSSQAPLRPR